MGNGFCGLVLCLEMVLFGYLGVEVMGVRGGEGEKGKKRVGKGIDKVFWGILVF